MIEAQDLHKRFGEIHALRGVSFTAADGAITGVVGENGAGKTTTLALICGLLAPDTGRVHVDGAVIDRRQRLRHIGALLDHSGLYARLTTREQIAYFAGLQGLSGPEMRQRIEEIITVCDLDQLADRTASTLSQGERMKVAIARAIVHAPRNVLLDEPTNGLDVPSVRGLRTLVARMRDEGRCVVFSSHVLSEVRALCDHIVILSRGRVVADGSVEKICAEAGTATLEEAFVKLTGGRRTSCETA